MKKKERVRYYSDFDFDFEETKNQNYKLSKEYVWVRRKKKQKVFDFLLYRFAHLVSGVWCRVFLRMKIHKNVVLWSGREGGFIFANHTQPVGDVFIPAHTTRKRVRTVVSPANFGIPIIGRLLPALGALPVPSEIARLKMLEDAIVEYTSKGEIVVIYPEGHVWEYCNEIRPFSEAAFMYPIKTEKPTFSLTTVYKNTKFRKKPKLHLYIDGPFYPNKSLPPRERYRELCQRVKKQMEERITEGDSEYVKYIYQGEKGE